MYRKLAAALVVAALVAACSSTASTNSPAATVAPVATATMTAPPTSAPTPSPTPRPVPSAAPAGSVVIVYEETAQVELLAPSGRRVLIDVYNPDALTRPPTAEDILLTTHSHSDHYLQSFVDSFPGKKLTFEDGTIEAADISVRGIAGLHDEAADSMRNEIYIIDIAGIRIVHFGDLGQSELTAEQRSAIGTVDVLVAQLANDFSTCDVQNRKCFKLVGAAAPRVLIPTHMMGVVKDVVVAGAGTWAPVYSPNKSITLTRSILPAKTTVLFMGDQAALFGRFAGANAVDW